ncbi:MAG: N-acetyltransferase [Prolixibacteraceae bacterium]|jgi:ribosomal protein S18 acetylase RimI-like enzyme|nr:N-acetyltransferase [Prolixibacteraceae bacterium]
MEITFAYLSDYEEILKVQKLAFKQEADLYEKCTIGPMCQTLNEMVEECASKIVLKGILKNELIASVRATQTNTECHINKLIVLPEHQGKGYGKKLLLDIENYFIKATKFVLETGAKSVKNINLYKKAGYQIVDKGYFHDGIEAVIMEKISPQPPKGGI